jgi:hypothetical protein
MPAPPSDPLRHCLLVEFLSYFQNGGKLVINLWLICLQFICDSGTRWYLGSGAQQQTKAYQQRAEVLSCAWGAVLCMGGLTLVMRLICGQFVVTGVWLIGGKLVVSVNL